MYKSLFPDFRHAYEPDGLTVDEFDAFGLTVRTFRQFSGSYQELVALVRDCMLPNLDMPVTRWAAAFTTKAQR
ncbi:MAG: hypothetical protein FJ011_03140 [Chloroflexi bacterium]|nr:hypothetical protein [Chloroflexota bacterium]